VEEVEAEVEEVVEKVETGVEEVVEKEEVKIETDERVAAWLNQLRKYRKSVE